MVGEDLAKQGQDQSGQDPGANAKSNFLNRFQQPPDPGAQQSAWNPSGYWPDPYDSRFKKSFRPHEFIGSLVNSQAGQDYGNPEGTAETIGVQGERAGEQATTEEATQESASQGLGRGYAAQQKSDIHQQTNARVSETMLGAHLEGQTRRWQQAALIANSLLEANKARFTAYLNKQAANSAESSALIGALGTIGGGLIGGILGGPVGAGIGAAIGGGGAKAAGGGGGGGSSGEDSVGFGGQGMS
jgi:hypothetical protein